MLSKGDVDDEQHELLLEDDEAAGGNPGQGEEEILLHDILDLHLICLYYKLTFDLVKA